MSDNDDEYDYSYDNYNDDDTEMMAMLMVWRYILIIDQSTYSRRWILTDDPVMGGLSNSTWTEQVQMMMMKIMIMIII